ncbi:MFS transporter [Clostridium polynesiense]|uniref:MFS transporter n=1 Tax=Clostridium polynesiense TaxID=1325933 RepID=UPI00058F495D|nr:MFS transporter [Clostridium polynesiense]
MSRKERNFFIILAIQGLAFNFAHPVTPTLIKSLNLNSYMFGIAFASMALTSFLFSQFWGYMSNKRNEGFIFMICCILYSFSQFMFLKSVSELDIIIARSIGGCFIAGINVSSLNYIVRISPKESRAQNITLFASITAITAAFGYLIGGFAGNSDIKYSFYLQIITLIAAGVAFNIIGIKRDTCPKIRCREMINQSNPAFFLSKNISISKSLVFTLTLALISTIAATAYDQTFNYYIKDIFDFKPSSNGLIKSIIGAITMAVNSTICIYIEKKGIIRKSLIYIFLGCAVNLILAILFDNVVLFMLFNFIFVAFNALHVPLIQAMLTTSKDNSFNVLGFYNTMKSLGWIIGGVVAGITYSFYYKLPFIIAIICFFIIFAISLPYRNEEGPKSYKKAGSPSYKG